MRIAPKQMYMFAAVLGISVSLLAFQNCAESVNLEEVSAAKSSTSNNLAFKLSKTQFEPSQSMLLEAKGGKPPYKFSVVTGGATIVSSEYLQAGSAPGNVTVRVTDSAGTQVEIGILISTSTTASCPLPWGGSIPHNTTIPAYSAATAACGTTCAAISETRSCANSALSGTFSKQTCVVAACAMPVWVQTLNTYTETHAQTCTRVGKVVSADVGYGTCASAENHPNMGLKYDKIVYTFPVEGNAGTVAGTKGVLDKDEYHCYRPGQSTNDERSDIVMAYLCK